MAHAYIYEELLKVFKPVKKKALRNLKVYSGLLDRAAGLKTITPSQALQVSYDTYLDIKSKYENKNYCLLDSETTGNDPFRDEAIEVAVVDSKENIVYESMFECVGEISEGASNVHKITKKDLIGYNYLIEKIHDLRDVLSKYDFISIYNERFDTNIINSTCYKQKEHGIKNIDSAINEIDNYFGAFETHDLQYCFGSLVLLWDNKYSHWKWLKLEGGKGDESMKDHQSHRASVDCIALNRCINFVINKIDDEIFQNTIKAAKIGE